MLQVPIDKIMPVTEARRKISSLVSDVEKGNIYVLTRGGKPSVVLSSVGYIQKLNNGKNINTEGGKIEPYNENDKKNELVTTEEINNLPAKKEKQKTIPESEKDDKKNITISDDKNKNKDVQKEEKNDKEEENVPIKISSGKWNE